MNIALVTAKGNNTQIRDKNLTLVNNVPVLGIVLKNALMASNIDRTYITTECFRIKEYVRREFPVVEIIDRPEYLSTPESQHSDVIEHGVEHITEIIQEEFNCTVLLGNTVSATTELIDRSLDLLETDAKISGVMSVWKAQDDHPFRAMYLNEDGYAMSYLDRASSSNRQSYPSIYFYDQGVWTFRSTVCHERLGPSPWIWMGNKVKLLERPWVTGRDIHSHMDVLACNWFINHVQPAGLDEIHEL